MDDMSGWNDGAWCDVAVTPGSAVTDLLRHCGDAYLPFFKANLAALEASKDAVALEIWGQMYRQRPFKYQGKCYRILRERFAVVGRNKLPEIPSVMCELTTAAKIRNGG